MVQDEATAGVGRGEGQAVDRSAVPGPATPGNGSKPQIGESDNRTQIRVLTGPEMREIPQPDGVNWPEDSLFVCAFRDGQMVGRVGLIALPHIEGTWVAPEMRGTTLAARMFRRMEQEVKGLGRTHLLILLPEDDKTLDGYVARVGYERLGVSMWAKELKGA